MILGFRLPLILAPMSGFTNVAFRVLCSELGADIVISEMISSKSLIKENKIALYRTLRGNLKSEIKYGIQLLISSKRDLMDFYNFYDDSSWFKENKLDFIDINLGCSKQKIVKQNIGAALLQPKLQSDLISILNSIDSSPLPVSIKIRAGFRRFDLPRLSKIFNKTDLTFITLHSRLSSENYSVPAHIDWMEEFKELSTIPVVFNGDFKEKSEIQKIISNLKPDGIMIGRFALRNPSIFSILKDLPPQEHLVNYKNLLTYLKEYNIYDTKIVKLFSLFFLRNYRNSRSIRKKLNSCSDKDFIIESTIQKIQEN